MKIVTHNGEFHADDVAAVATLLLLYPEAGVDRTRDPKIIAAADIVVDVGAVYDERNRRFDHHQAGGARTRKNGIPHSSFGLVWRVFGNDALKACNVREGWVKQAHTEIDRLLVQPIDATDCGMRLYTGGTPVDSDVKNYSISRVVKAFNPLPGASETEFYGGFMDAVAFFQGLLRREIARAAHNLLEVAEIERRIAAATDPRIVELAHGGPGWDKTVCKFEAPIFVVFEAETKDIWMVQCVPPSPGSFAKRQPLPAAWAGLRDAEFAALTGVTDAVFCHNSLFICGAKSRESAMKLARFALFIADHERLHAEAAQTH